MTTIRQLITDGYRESGIIAVGASPDAEEHEEGLRQIRRIIRSFFGHELGENLITIDDTDVEDYVPENSRVVFNSLGPVSVYLHPDPADGARFGFIDRAINFSNYPLTINGNNRSIEAADDILIDTDGANQEYFYRQDLANWVRITDPDADDESPFPSEFDDLLTTALAFRLNPRYGAETTMNLMEILSMMKKRFRARYRQETEMDSEIGLLLLPSTFRRGRYDPEFNRG